MAWDAQPRRYRFGPYAPGTGVSRASGVAERPFGDYPLQRTTTLHSPGVFHMLQFRSYKYLDQISAESKALAT